MYRPGFTERGESPLGTILVSWWAIISKGAKGGRGDFKTVKLTLDILELQMKSKKKGLRRKYQ